MSSGKHYTIAINPRGGRRRGQAILEDCRQAFDAAGATLDIHLTEGPGHVTEMARQIDPAQTDAFCVVGGDGTLHEAVNGLMSRDPASTIPLGAIPAGTGNTVLHHFHCVEPADAVKRILAGKTQPLDVMQITTPTETYHSANVVGWGAVVDINQTAEKLRLLGPSRYTLAALWQIAKPRRRRAELIIDGQSLSDDFLLVAACNTRFTGKGMELAPKARADDGKMDLVFVRSASRGTLLQVFRRVFDGSHIEYESVEYHQVQTLELRTPDAHLLNMDGELKGATPVTIRMIPRALSFLI